MVFSTHNLSANNFSFLRERKSMVRICRRSPLWVNGACLSWVACHCDALFTFWRMFVPWSCHVHNLNKCPLLFSYWGDHIKSATCGMFLNWSIIIFYYFFWIRNRDKLLFIIIIIVIMFFCDVMYQFDGAFLFFFFHCFRWSLNLISAFLDHSL